MLMNMSHMNQWSHFYRRVVRCSSATKMASVALLTTIAAILFCACAVSSQSM